MQIFQRPPPIGDSGNRHRRFITMGGENGPSFDRKTLLAQPLHLPSSFSHLLSIVFFMKQFLTGYPKKVVGPRSNSAFSTATVCYNAMTLAAKNGVLILPRSRRKLRRTVIIVDDDTSMLRAIARLVRADGFEVLAFDRPSLLLAADIPESNACLVLDVNLPEMDGVELYETLAAAGRRLPVIMITGRNDSKTQRLIERVKAVSVLLKPFNDTAFLEVIYRALAISK